MHPVLDYLFSSVEHSLVVLRANFSLLLSVLAVLWAVQLLNRLLGYRLNVLGIYPRHVMGLPGIVLSPFLHKDFEHLFLNSVPLFILLNVVVLYGVHTALYTTVFVTLVSGAAIWLFARRGIHIGASALVFGYFGFAIGGAIYTHNLIAIVSAVLCLFYLGSLLVGLLPTQRDVSWEGHLAGFLSGFLCSYGILA